MSRLLVIAGAIWIAAVPAIPSIAVENPDAAWDKLDAILKRIHAPEFPNRSFAVTDYGAVGDGKTDGKPAIAAAIAACQNAGGGRVVVPQGEWLINGPIHLKSGVELHLEKGATIRFSTDAPDYLPVVFTRFEGTELMNYSPLVYAHDAENVAITGEGTLDGQAAAGRWWQWKGKWGGDVDHGWKKGDADQTSATKRLIHMADDGIEPSKRLFGENSQLRPNFVQFYRCKNVLIEGFTIVNSPMWILHPVLCDNVTIRGVTVVSHGPNNDGCDPESSRDVLIENCTFDTGDDCIAIKSGKNADGRRLAAPCENIVVRNCTMKDGHGGVTLGSEMSGGIRNVFVEDCKMSSPRLERAIRLKSNTQRGGYMDGLYVRRVEVGEVREAVLDVNLRYFGETGDYPPTVKNIYLDQVSAEKSKRAVSILGITERPVENVLISNSRFEQTAEPNLVEHVVNFEFRKVDQSAHR
jgi:polygalacturonase